MSLNDKGSSCVRCHAYIFPEDDIVYCPICGAPHHRECYNALGHCALEELHGTEQQYSKEKEELARESISEKDKAERESKEDSFTTCRMCGASYYKEIRHCPECGTPNLNRFDGFPQFDLLGGVPADLDLGDGITADEAKRFVASNPHRYIPKFALLNKKKKASWNWMAFFFPCEWMLSRKMYKSGILAGIFCMIVTLLMYPFNLSLYNFGFYEIESRNEAVEMILERFSEISGFVILAAFIALIVDLIVRIICGIFGDYWYKKYTLSTIKKIRAESQDMEYDYRKKGGVNIYLFLLGLLALQYIPQIIMTLI